MCYLDILFKIYGYLIYFRRNYIKLLSDKEYNERMEELRVAKDEKYENFFRRYSICDEFR